MLLNSKNYCKTPFFKFSNMGFKANCKELHRSWYEGSVKLLDLQSRITLNHPMWNGIVECFYNTMIKILGTLYNTHNKDWIFYVTSLAYAYNAMEHDSTAVFIFFYVWSTSMHQPPKHSIHLAVVKLCEETSKVHEAFIATYYDTILREPTMRVC